MRRQILNDIEVIHDYEEGLSCNKIAEKFGVHRNTVLYCLKKNGIDTSIKNRRYSKSKYSFNEHFLDKIDSEEKAYFLGFFYADGNVQALDNKRNYLIRIKLQESDDYILQRFMNMFESNKPLIYKEEKTSDGKVFKKCEFALGNKYLWERLQELGCSTQKTIDCDFPDFIEDKYMNAFIRGLFDGDGSVNLIPLINKEKQYGCESYFVGTYNEMKKLQKYLYKTIGIKGNLCNYKDNRPNRKNLLWYLEFGKQKEVKQLGEWMYKNSSIHLIRKYNKYIKFINIRTDL